MNVLELKAQVAALPDSERPVIILTADGDLLGIAAVAVEDGTPVIKTAAAAEPAPGR